ncbi:hypothetical protein M378DRAFT_16361 [Amanita muscaria Koide BX008]|uniref:Uncharacterized protein n=1 Tax=Amanita muscaria (strain Koide BX008) TaxID=946122 RepID=A0A0C2WM26_AMAMK|nr:hypothetical protein M378DRAFT_16361 [Amanita muscaria Koide BX008]
MDPYFCDSEQILRLASPEDLVRAGNASYLDARSMIEDLQAELMRYKVALQTTQEIHQNAIRMGIGATAAPSQSNACETPAASVYNLLKPDQGLPAPLQREEYSNVRFWRREQYDKWLKMNKGDTNGLAAEKPKRGRPRKSENEEEDNVHHPYLETVSGMPVNSAYLYRLSVKARRIWATLLKFGQAPDSYSEMDELSREYFILGPMVAKELCLLGYNSSRIEEGEERSEEKAEKSYGLRFK